MHKMLKQYLFILLLVFSFSFVSSTNFAGGDGSSGNPYQITNWTALSEMNTCLSCYYVLNNNLDSSTSDYSGIGNAWVPIGNNTLGYYFTGFLDGNGYSISDFICSGGLYRGLIGYMGSGWVRNLTIINSSVTSTGRAGILVAQAVGDFENIEIWNSSIIGTGTTNTQVGGLIGYYSGGGSVGINNVRLYNVNSTHFTGTHSACLVGVVAGATGTINNSFCINGFITGSSFVGGLVGASSGRIQNSYFDGQVNGTGTVGGICGSCTQSANYPIFNLSSSGYVNGTLGGVGGIAGARSGTGGITYNVYSNMSIYLTGTGASHGGLFGSLTAGTLSNSSFSGSIKGYQAVGGCIGTMSGATASLNQCFVNSAYINASQDYVGGIVGRITNGKVNNSYSTANVITQTSYSGGAVGRTELGLINNSYSTGNVTCTTTTYCGGFVGFDTGAGFSVTNSYWDMNTSGWTTSVKGVGYTTAQMKNISSFSNWTIQTSSQDLNNGYPYLAFQNNGDGVWLIWDGTSANCWSKVGTAIFITTPCFVPLGYI